jgi:hypothetical protein
VERAHEHTCPWCDRPGYCDLVEWGRTPLFNCGHFDYELHENSVGDAANNTYEELCRWRGIEMLPWEYPHLNVPRHQTFLEPLQFSAAFRVGYSAALRAVLRSAENVHGELLTTSAPSRTKWMLEGIMLAHTIADDCRESVLCAVEEAYRDVTAVSTRGGG